MSEESKRPGMARFVLPGVLVAGSIGYAFAIHHGFGPRPEVPDSALRWWSPRGFAMQELLGTSWEWLLEERGKGMAMLGAPSLLLLAAVFATTRSALARVTALVASFATLLFLYYALGVGVTQVAWNFFHWRASGTMLAVAAVIGCAIGSPWLAASWLRLGWPARVAWFLPVIALVLVIERNVTGTNDALPFAISPWPAVQVFGFEAIGTTIAAQLAGVALALFGVRAWRKSKRRLSGAVLILAGIATPALAWRAFSLLELLPFRVTQERMIGAAIFCTALIALAAIGVRFDPKRLRARAIHAAVAAGLVGVPLLVGTGWARWDYTRTRDQNARLIIEALEAYYARESVYPDTLCGARRGEACSRRSRSRRSASRSEHRRDRVHVPGLRHQLPARVLGTALGAVRLQSPVRRGRGRGRGDRAGRLRGRRRRGRGRRGSRRRLVVVPVEAAGALVGVADWCLLPRSRPPSSAWSARAGSA